MTTQIQNGQSVVVVGRKQSVQRVKAQVGIVQTVNANGTALVRIDGSIYLVRLADLRAA